mmetsp:Transcript_4857/g.5852  ORF Transcript_4857/g.5852 Transcript_4857/m.5852 type:complete len:83 (-) Transcript_4857:2145-2393(-)
MMVRKRWATITQVRFLFASFRACMMPTSVATSTADVTSSQSMTRGARRMVRAIATLCRSPPDKIAPRSPTLVSYPSFCRITA